MLRKIGIEENNIYYIAGPDKLPAPLNTDEENENIYKVDNCFFDI